MQKHWFGIGCLLIAQSLISVSAFDIVKDGKPAAVVILGRRTKSTLLASEVLVHAVERCSGARLQVMRPAGLKTLPAGMNRIFIGDCEYLKSKNLRTSDLLLEEYLIKVQGKDLFLLGHDKETPEWRATGAPGTRHPDMDSRQYSPAHLWAVAELLDRSAGVRFLWPGEQGTYYPKQKTISVRNGYTLKARPVYERRQIWFGAGTHKAILPETNKYMMIHQQGSRINSWFIDAFADWWKLYSESNPEIFALSPEGKRGYFYSPVFAKLCLSNPETAKLVLKTWRAAGRPDTWSMCPNDSVGFCTCPNCRKMDSPEAQKATADQVWRARVSLTNRYVTFWNKVIGMMKKENPKVQIFVFGYGPYKLFPKGRKLDSHVCVAVVPGDFDVRGFGMKQYRSWSESGARLFLRPNWQCTFPFTNYFPMRQVLEFMEEARKHGCVGYEQTSIMGCWAAEGVYYYAMARNSYRPELSLDEIKKEFASAFGKGAPDILKWIQYWEDYTDRLRGGIAEEPDAKTGGLYEQICSKNKRIRSHILYGCWDALAESYPPEVMNPAYKMLSDAAAKIGKDDPESLGRVEFLKKGMDHVILMQKAMKTFWNKPLGRSPEFMKDYNTLYAFRRSNEANFVVSIHDLMYNEFTRNINMVPFNANGSRPKEADYRKNWFPKNKEEWK